MSKTFNNNDKNDARTLEVDRLYGGARLTIIDANRKGFLVADADAPALALAILEAAGHGGSSESSRLMQAFDLIELHVKEQERATAEAKEHVELEAEALELYRTFYCSDASWVDVFKKETWLAVARRAREMAKESTK